MLFKGGLISFPTFTVDFIAPRLNLGIDFLIILYKSLGNESSLCETDSASSENVLQ